MYDDIIDNYRSSFHFPMFSILVKEDELIPQLFTLKFDGILNVLKGQSLLRTTLILMKDRIYIKLWDISLYWKQHLNNPLQIQVQDTNNSNGTCINQYLQTK